MVAQVGYSGAGRSRGRVASCAVFGFWGLGLGSLDFRLRSQVLYSVSELVVTKYIINKVTLDVGLLLAGGAKPV
jgi:hypothetical protein